MSGENGCYGAVAGYFCEQCSRTFRPENTDTESGARRKCIVCGNTVKRTLRSEISRPW